ncbi:MAG: hypothetical protein NXH85_01970 [Pseudomonadaceae bacterium]|nr:hypothetical protein [Pseudomonadaceae bacterium]
MKSSQRMLAAMLIAATSLLATVDVGADALAPVMINGQQLTMSQWQGLSNMLGEAVMPGVYLVDGNGCWLNTSNGSSGCVGSSDVFSRYGSGSRDSNGNWNHWSDAAGGAVGGTSDGCVYTSFGWSSC